MTTSTRPRVVVAVTATADGRVTLNRGERLLDPGAGARWESVWPADVTDLLARRAALIEDQYHPTVVLEGSGTFVAGDAPPLDLPPADLPAAELRRDFVPEPSPKWFAVVDGRGRIPWTMKQDGDTRLLVLACHETPLPYLAHLRRENIPYLLAGGDRVDLPRALAALGTRLGATCVLAQAGGTLNGALLRAGLVDELHVITVPALVGGLGTPSIMDGPASSSPVRLRTVDVTVGAHGSVWAHYEVQHPWAAAERIAAGCAEVLGDTLRSVILHGSLAAGDFRPGRSDIDLLVVVGPGLTGARAAALEQLARTADLGGASGLDLHVVTEDVTRSPGPAPALELHVGRYDQSSIGVEVERRAAADPDLPAELSMARAGGRALLGAAPHEVIGPIPARWLIDRSRHWVTTWQSRTHETEDAAFMALTACRMWHFAVANVHASKTGAARWALARDPSLVAARQALNDPAGPVDETALATLLARVRDELADR